MKRDGSLAVIGDPGELWVKGGQVVLGYYRNAAACVSHLILRSIIT